MKRQMIFKQKRAACVRFNDIFDSYCHGVRTRPCQHYRIRTVCHQNTHIHKSCGSSQPNANPNQSWAYKKSYGAQKASKKEKYPRNRVLYDLVQSIYWVAKRKTLQLRIELFARKWRIVFEILNSGLADKPTKKNMTRWIVLVLFQP